jgi:hypothetical protein
MKKILLQVGSIHLAHNALFRVTGPNDPSDPFLEPWRALKRRCAELGYELTTADNNSLDDCAFILFIDSASVDGLASAFERFKSFLKERLKLRGFKPWPIRNLYQEAVKKGMTEQMMIILWEGRAVSPRNYSRALWNKFSRICTWDDDLVDNKKFFKFHLPIPALTSSIPTIPFTQKKLLVNVTANKYSSDSNELYSARRSTIEYFSKHHPDDFDLCGVKWNKPATLWQKRFPFLVPHYPTYRGMVDNKLDTIRNYKFTLAYENMAEANGYITEKIFDALKAKTVPIYWGADNISTYVPPEAFIDRRSFKTEADMAHYIATMDQETYDRMLAVGQEYLGSEQFQKFLIPYFCETIIRVLGLKNT